MREVNATILIDGPIKAGFADKLRTTLDKYSGIVEIHLRSPGGDGAEGLAAANVIKRHAARKGDVDVVVLESSSAATFLVAAATNRMIVSWGHMVLHAPSMASTPTASTERMLAVFQQRMLDLYAERAVFPSQIKSVLESRRDFIFDANTAVEHGLVDAVLSSALQENYDEKLIS